MATDLSQYSDVIKTAYGPRLNDLQNDKTILLNRIEKGSEFFSFNGKNWTIPLWVSGNAGVGSGAEGDALPAAGVQGYDSGILPNKYSRGVFEITRPLMKNTAQRDNNFVNALSQEMKGLMRNLKDMENRQFFGYGSGLLATCSSASSATAITVETTVIGTRWLKVGQRVSVLLKSSGAVNSVGVASDVIAAIDATTGIVTLTTGVAVYASIDSTYGIYAYAGATSYNLEPYGLGAIVSASDTVTGGFMGILVAAGDYWKSKVTAIGGAVDMLDMDTMFDDVEQAGNGEISALIGSYGVLRAVNELYRTNHMYTNLVKMDDGRPDVVPFRGKPILADKHCQKGYLWFLDEKQLVRMVLSDWDFADEDGGILTKVSGYDKFTGYAAKYGNLGTFARNAHGVATGITEA